MAANSNGNSKGAHLKPYQFRRGVSGNPSGRPQNKGLAAMIREKTEDGAAVVRVLVDVLEGREPRAKVADRIEAARLLMDRAWGRPLQAMELSGPDGGPIQSLNVMANVDTDTLHRLVELRDQVLALQAQQLPTPDGNAPAS